MKNKFKNILKIVIILLIIYLFISSFYILVHIDFENAPETVGMGFSESNNKLRFFLGLPPTHSTYGGVEPIYLIFVVVRILLAVILFIVNKKFFIKKEI